MSACSWLAACAAAVWGLGAAAAEPAGVALFDTGARLARALPAGALADRAGWRAVPRDTKAHAFQGEAVLANARLAVVLRRGASGAEVYAKSAKGWRQRARLAPLAGQEAGLRPGVAGKLSSVRVVGNDANAVSVDAAFAVPGGEALAVRFEVQIGQPIVKTEARGGAFGLRVEAPCRFGVLPDFFADDIVLDATHLPAARAEVPSEHFFLHMGGSGESIVMAAWDTRDREIRVALSGEGDARTITASEIACGKGGKTWVAVLEAAGVWHARTLRAGEARKAIPLGWKMPFPAAWRADFTAPGGLTESWELIAQQPNGRYRFMKPRPDFFGKKEKEFPANRKGWSTALSSFHHPCWVDREGSGFVQFGTHRHFQYAGSVLVYPLDRGPKTPLAAYTVVDVMRNSLGVGPCEYILDLEGQKVANRGLFTCGARATLNRIYKQRQQRTKRAEIEKVLVDVLVFVKAIRERIDRYVAFGREMRELLAAERKAHPALGKFIDEMDGLARRIDARFAARKEAIRTPQYVARLTDQFRRDLLDTVRATPEPKAPTPGRASAVHPGPWVAAKYEGADAYGKCSAITAAIVRVGDSQDHLVAECRMAIKVLRQRAGLAMAADAGRSPAVEKLAREIRARAHKVLRGQLGHEGALYR